MKKRIDVLLVARPDHSMQIYRALLSQNVLTYCFLAFKIFPEWLKKVVPYKKMTTVSKNAICSWRLTFINLCRYKFKFGFAQKWDETSSFDKKLKYIFKKNNVKLIHYWPEYGDIKIQEYVRIHSDTIAVADIHMPHPVAVYESMKPIYVKYGIDPERTHLYVMAKEQCHFVDNAIDVLVPSSYVANTYKKLYEDKRYHVVSYGIPMSKTYQKRYRDKVSEFVYAGRISLEKGADLLLDFFSLHTEFNIHLYGGIPNEQSKLFEKYRKFSNILFHGSVPKVELQNKMKNYDVGIHLSRFDAYSLAVGEMIGSGLPVIVSDHTGNMDDIINENIGLVVKLDQDSISSAVMTITQPVSYNKFIDSIDDYLVHRNVPYGDKILRFYQENLNK